MRGVGARQTVAALITVAGVVAIMGVGAAVAVAVNQGCPRNRHVTGAGFTMESTGRLLKSAPYDGGDAGTVPDDGWVVGYGVTTGATETDTDVLGSATTSR